MKHKLIILFLLALALALMLTPMALAATAQARVSPDTPVSGSGHYHLTRVTGQISSGGSYYLTGPASPDLTGDGCCCTYLPCIVR
jgi:hypothetical protein